jgi:amphi-Trp domain-containing protein
MGDETTNAETVDRETAADRLEDIASALRNDDDLRVRVGNKEITLHPTESLDYRIRVVEKRPRFRGRRETVEVELGWSPD